MITIKTDERGTKVWRDDKFGFPRYSITISKKDGDNYVNAYQAVAFKKGIELKNGEEIIIDNAFPTFNVGKDGKKYMSWMVTEFKRMNEREPGSNDKFIDIPDGIDEELPFV